MSIEGLFQLITSVIWSDDPKTQISIGLVIGWAIVVLVWVYLPLLLKLSQSRKAQKKLKKAVYGKYPHQNLRRDAVKKVTEGTYIELHVIGFITKWNNSKDSKARTPVRFSSMFDERPLLPTGWRRSLLPSIPGIFLALGILGTFVGLTLALNNTGNTPEAFGQQIETLVSSLSLAFRTSLWGIFLSISFVVLIRLLEGAFEVDEESIDLLMHKAFPWISGSEIAAQSLLERRNETSKLQNSLTEVAMSLENAIASGLEKIEKSTSSAANVISQELIEKLGQTLQEGVGAHVDSLRSAIAETTKMQKEVGVSIALAFEEIKQATTAHGETAARLSHAAGAVENAAEGLAKSASEFAPAVENLALTGESLKSTSASMAQVQDKSAATVISVKEVLEEAHKSLDQQRELVEGTLAEMRSAIEQLSEGLSDDLVSALQNIDGILGGAVGRLNGTINDSNEMIDRLSPAVGQVLEVSQRILGLFSELGASIDRFGSQMGSNLTPIPDAIGELRDANVGLVSQLGELHIGLKESIRELDEHIKVPDKGDSNLALQVEKLAGVITQVEKSLAKPKLREKSALVQNSNKETIKPLPAKPVTERIPERNPENSSLSNQSVKPIERKPVSGPVVGTQLQGKRPAAAKSKKPWWKSWSK